MDNDTKQMMIRVEGRVQGVFFRATTQKKAKTFGIVGYAKNLPDGSVEILAQGKAEDLSAFTEWVKKGPPLARVDHVAMVDLPVDRSLRDFTIGR